MRDASFSRDAPRELALAREQKLHALRQRFAYASSSEACDGDPQDVAAAVEWIEQLARTGHVSAARLLRKVARRSQAVFALSQAAPDLLARIGRDPQETQTLVTLGSLYAVPRDVDRTEQLMQLGGPAMRELGQHLRTFREAGATLQEQDLEILRSMVWFCGRDDARGLKLGREKRLLKDLAQWRLESPDEEARKLGGMLARKAVGSGDPTAWGLCWKHEWAQEVQRLGSKALDTPQALAFALRWFAQGQPAVRESASACVFLAFACETGKAGQAQDYAQALVWWERAFCGSPKLEQDGTPGPAFCQQVANWLKTVRGDSPLLRELVAAWEARGAQARSRAQAA